MLETSGLLSGCGNLCNTASLVVVLEGIRNFKSSIIEAFASLLLLSLGKMLSISFDLLVPARLYNIHGEQVNKMYLFYDATVEVFSSKHISEMLPQVFRLLQNKVPCPNGVH